MYICNERPLYISQIAVFTDCTTRPSDSQEQQQEKKKKKENLPNKGLFCLGGPQREKKAR